jgi:hypothetical protein
MPVATRGAASSGSAVDWKPTCMVQSPGASGDWGAWNLPMTPFRLTLKPGLDEGLRRRGPLNGDHWPGPHLYLTSTSRPPRFHVDDVQCRQTRASCCSGCSMIIIIPSNSACPPPCGYVSPTGTGQRRPGDSVQVGGSCAGQPLSQPGLRLWRIRL